MKLQTAEYYFREVCVSMVRKRWMTFASIGTVAVSLFVLGLFLILVLNMSRLAASLESRVQIAAYLDDALTPENRAEVERMARAMKNVTAVEYVPKERALEILQARLGDQRKILDALGETNPLPNYFLVTVDSAQAVRKTAAALADLYGVEEVSYGQDVVDSLFDLTRLLRIFGVALLIILALATVFIISNTIRLTVFARRREIAIMKYVGATDWFIRWPFILEGVALGLIGGGISAVVLRNFYSAVAAKISSALVFFPLVEQYPFMNYLTAALIFSGVAIGILGSTVSLKKFLEV
ncbi:MAG: permease-like cell division protein FtsX [Selenomonadaceae bacterium]|nr:permease-like cell division protein FtsX [Selenomonadaceae bacterium]